MTDDGIPASQSSRLVLEGVPRIGEDVDAHLCPFPGALYAYLEYVGDRQDYDYLMGVTGAAFRRFWNRDDGGNIDLSLLGEEPFRRVFDALGYEWTEVPDEKEAMIQAIRSSLARGRPAISFGIVGPPEAGLVTGYAKDGAVLYGWSYFQDQSERYYEKRNWFETMDKHAGKGLIILGDRLPARPAPRDVLVTSLQWALELERTAQWPALPNHVAGLAAYDAWAAALEVDADYPAEDAEVLTWRVMIHGRQSTMLYERCSAAQYLRQMAEAVSEAAEPLTAAAASAPGADALWPWGYLSPGDPKAQQGIADGDTRREMAREIRAAKSREAEAVVHLEAALDVLRH